MDEKLEAKNKAKDYIENRIRGKFIGCQYVIRITLKDGTSFTNIDFFQGKAKVKPEDVAIKIEIENTDNADYLVEKMYNSTSIIRVSDDARTDYQSRMIANIDQNWSAIDALKKTFYIISKLKGLERSILIMHGIVGYEFIEITERGNATSYKTKQRTYCQALKNFEFIKEMIEE